MSGIANCKSNPCENGGSCHQYLYTFTCSCHEMFDGRLCNTRNFTIYIYIYVYIIIIN